MLRNVSIIIIILKYIFVWFLGTLDQYEIS